MYSIDGMVSDAEGEDGQRESARSAAWRHSDIHHLNMLLDEAYVQLGNTPRIKRERRLNIANSRHPNLPDAAHEIAHENIPKEIPQNWVKPEYFSRLTDIEKLGLKFKDNVNLRPAIEYLQARVQRTHAPFNPMASGSR